MELTVFRELGYGAMFFLSAMLGMACGVMLVPESALPRHIELPMEVRCIVGGTVAGAALWLTFRFFALERRHDPPATLNRP